MAGLVQSLGYSLRRSLRDGAARALTLVRGEMKGIAVERELARSLPVVHLDVGKISQVFINEFLPGGFICQEFFFEQVTGAGIL